MMPLATVIDGKAIALQTRQEVAERVAILNAEGITPGLGVILVGEDPASTVYVRNKVSACKAAGISSFEWRLPAETSEQELMKLIDNLNTDETIHGILIQLPLPGHINSQNVLEAITPNKDVDGFHVMNAGALMVGKEGFKPCTPYGVMKILESRGIEVKGKDAVIIGRSNIVGKPMTMMLLQAGATVTNCWHETRDVASYTRHADIIVTATGVPDVLTADMVKPGAVIIDVGIIKGVDGKLRGDVDYAGVSKVAGYITPVPGGVGPMTIAMLLVNTLHAAERHSGSQRLRLASQAMA